jgi:uncharacterized membrane protein YeiB
MRSGRSAGPTHPLPTQRQERISSIDVLRGVALLGILIASLTSFGLPEWACLVPLSIAKPAFSGPHAHINTVVWFARWVSVEGKMRGLFSLLFGGGVIPLTSRAEKRGASDKSRRHLPAPQHVATGLRRNSTPISSALATFFISTASPLLSFSSLSAI